MAQARTRPRDLPQVFSAEEVEALLAQPNLDAPTGLRNRCMLGVMLKQGLRAQEVCDLWLRDVQWREHQLRLRAEATKTKTEAYQTLDRETEALLERWKPVRRRFAVKDEPWLFIACWGENAGGQLDRRYLWKMVRNYARRAGIDGRAFPHKLRHTLGTQLLREGHDIREVQTVLRHADVRTTTVYTHIATGQLHDRLRER